MSIFDAFGDAGISALGGTFDFARNVANDAEVQAWIAYQAQHMPMPPLDPQLVLNAYLGHRHLTPPEITAQAGKPWMDIA